MAVKITGIVKSSPAHRARIKKNDVLISVNGHEISDVLDYMFYVAEENLDLLVERKGKLITKSISKSDYDDLGMEFASFLMDEKRGCSNKCVFCFIDQMPPGMRETLYFKDDDARLSFLQGNYVTLTNLNDKDIQRIIDMRLNINVSVHTTNPELRCKMMNNRFAGEKLKYLKMIADSGLMLNCQIVCCPGINDGDELRRTLDDLSNLMPSVQSVAVVPVGITKFRDGLFPLECFNKNSAGDVIDIITYKQNECLKKYNRRMVFPADEFYIIAERELPPTEFYEDYPQYENGVGLLRSLEDELDYALDSSHENVSERTVTLVTGVAAYDFHVRLSRKIMDRFPNVKINVVRIINHFFGETITVAGLITATDIIDQLKGKELGEELIIPKVMLKTDEQIFLDDLTVKDVEKALGVKISASSNDGCEYLERILGIDYLS